jgi:predicted phage tail protein
MLTLVIVKNPFSPQDGREVKQIEAGKTLAELLTENAIDGVNLQATVNGYSVEDTTEIHDGDFVVIYPAVEKGDKGGKGILGIIAAIALSVVSFGIAGGGWLASSGFFAAGHLGAYLAAAAVMFIGSSLMGRFMGQNVDTGSYGGEKDDPSYSWGGVQTMEGQNNSIPLTYGLVKSGGQTISKFVTVDDNDEYLNWLVAAGEGEVDISDIRLNDNPYKNYSGVSVEDREGTNDQTVISGFGDTYNSKSVSRKLSTSWVTETVPGGNMIRGIMLEVTFPAGLYRVEDDGTRVNRSVTLDVEYKIDGGSWTNLFKDISASSAIYSGSNPVATSGCITLVGNIAAGNYTVTLKPKGNMIFGVDVSVGDYSCKVDGIIGAAFNPENDKDKFGNCTVTVGAFRINTKKFTEATMQSLRNGETVTTSVTVTSGGNGTITSKTNSALRKQFKINKLAEGEYSVRVRRVTGESKSDRVADSCELSMVSGIIYDDFSYPCTALIGIRAKATDQLSGSPSLTFMKERRYVYVWNGSAYVQKRANNPAWACYDLLHQCSYIKNTNTGNMEYEVRGVPANRMRYSDFAAWASWCNTMKLYVNIEINQVGEMLDVANQKIAPIGRGMVVRFGTKYGCIYDHVQQPVQMFGMGNIIAGTFQEEFLKVADRANCVEVTFTNGDADYQRDVVTVYGDTFNSDGYAKTAQLTMDGCTSYEQAYREGMYQLMCNKYQLRTVSFEADIDSIACTVGDVVLVAHDVPKWASSVRIEEVNGNTMKLPCYISDLSKSYRIQYRKVNDNLYTKPCTIVSSTEDGWTVIQVSDTSNMPEVGDVFDLAIANIGSKPFVIKNITRSQEFRRKITCIEYAEALYNEDYDIPPIQYAVPAYNKPKNVTQLSASQYAYTDSYGRKHNIMSVSWKKPSNGGKFTVLYSADKVTWITALSQIDSDSVEFEVPQQDWYVKVITTLGLRQSSGTISGLIRRGVDVPPADIKKFDVEKMANGLRRFWWEFDYPTPNDIAGFRLKYTQTNRLKWENGIPAQEGLVTSQPYETMMIRQGYNVIMIKAVDNAGQESKNFKYCVLDQGDLLEENVLWTVNCKQNGWNDFTKDGQLIHITHNGVIVNGNIASKVFDSTYMWTESDDYRFTAYNDYAWGSTHYEDLTAEVTFTTVASGQFWIESDVDGPCAIYYQKSHSENNWRGYNESRWHTEDTSRWTLYWDMEKQYSDKVMVKAGEVIKIKVVGISDGVKRTTIKGLRIVVDVPDLMEHFEDLSVPASGKQLDIKTPNYYTTAVRIDAIQNSTAIMVKYISRTPCVIQLVDASGTAVSGTADITWQGYQKEMII